MYEVEHLPEAYHSEDGRRVLAPTYELLADCHMNMRSSETGQTGPTLVEAGQVITTEMVPNHQWKPLNLAAAERYDAWLASLPVMGKGLSQEEIAEAAYMMRPREGEPEIPHEQWWSHVMKLAATLKDKRRGARPIAPAVGYRPGPSEKPIMPNAAIGSTTPPDPSRPLPQNVAQHQPPNPAEQAQRLRKAKVMPPMPGTAPAQGPQTAV